MSKYRSLDLDAARAEEEVPDGIEVTQRGETFILPAELPADVFDPFLSDEFDLAALIAELLRADESEGTARILMRVLFERPKLPKETLDAVKGSLRLLFGPEDWSRFEAARPSIRDYQRLFSGLFRLYGTSLGEAFASAASSVSDGPTPKQTSPASTDSTPDASGDDPEPATDSSESAA